MQFGDPSVVALEEGEEILGKVVLVEFGQCADDSEIECDVAIEVFAPVAYEDVARMHVGMEKTVAENLGEKDFNPLARQPLQVDARFAHPVDLVAHQSQCTSGMRSSRPSAKLRRNCAALAASRTRSSSSCR